MAAGALRSKVGLALAGGGPVGGIYEVGAMAALDEALEGADFNEFDFFVGVSSGSIIAAALANGLRADTLARMLVENDTDEVWHLGLFESFQRLSHALPAGVFDNAGIDQLLKKLFSSAGRSNDFRQLKHKLFLVATDLDSGESVAFGGAGHDDVPISLAVQASAALPGLFPPVKINGHYYVDGALIKTLHASVALREGADLVICINPLVPFDSELAARQANRKRHVRRPEHLVDGGLPVVLSQTFRAIIHSRMRTGMDRYRHEYEGSDVVLFEPGRDDAEMFFTNVFSYRSRSRLCEHAYQRTRTDLYRRRHELAPIFERHGFHLNLSVLRDHSRSLLSRKRHPDLVATATALDTSLHDLECWLELQKA